MTHLDEFVQWSESSRGGFYLQTEYVLVERNWISYSSIEVTNDTDFLLPKLQYQI